MSGAWRWLLGIDRIPPGAEGLEWSFERPLPAWAWLLVLVAAGALAWRSYRGGGLSRPRAAGLASLRFLLLAWIALLLAGPLLVLPRERREADRVVVLVDRSASLRIEDGRDPDGGRRSRERSLREMLEASSPVWRRLGERHELRWVAFDEDAREVPSDAEGLPTLGEAPPDGIRTRIGASLRSSLEIAAGRPIAGIVLISDGRTADPPGRSVLRRLAAESIPVFTVPLGSPTPPLDLAIEQAEAPRKVFGRDRVPVAVRIRSTGEATGPVGVRLVDRDGGGLVDRAVVEIAPGESQAEAILSGEAPEGRGGRLAWRVEIEGEDLLAENDRREIEIEVLDRPIRVLYVEGGPRWEYRFLKSLLQRERSIESSMLLLSADRDFAQEGDRPIARMPSSPEELNAYDLVILGDAPAGFFTPGQLELIRDLVAVRGGGLLVVGGPRHAPRSWERTPLAEMLPFAGPLSLESDDAPRRLAATEAAGRLGVLDFDDAEESLAKASWAALRWSQRIDPARLKPTAEVLAADAADGSPLLLRMRYGAGQVLYLATDETWRWRHGRGETLPERFWIPLLRLLARDAAAEDGAIRLRVSPTPVPLGESVSLELSIDDARAAALGLASVAVAIDGPDLAEATRIELLRGGETTYAASWEPIEAGTHRARVVEPELLAFGGDAEAAFEVDPAGEELRDLAADHGMLASLAESTGGISLGAEELERLVEAMPDRSVVVSDPLVERIWSSPLALAVAVLLLSLEWIGRRASRLA
jgi:uncharacterized membrane protein